MVDVIICEFRCSMKTSRKKNIVWCLAVLVELLLLEARMARRFLVDSAGSIFWLLDDACGEGSYGGCSSLCEVKSSHRILSVM